MTTDSDSREKLYDIAGLLLPCAVIAGVFLGPRLAPVYVTLLGLYLILHPLGPRRVLFKNSRLEASLLGGIVLFCCYYSAVTFVTLKPYDDKYILRPFGLEHPLEWMFIGILGSASLVAFTKMRKVYDHIDRSAGTLLLVFSVYAIAIYVVGLMNPDQLQNACRTGMAVFNPNIFAMLAAMLINLMFAISFRKGSVSLFGLLVLGGGVFALVALTGSRTAILASVVTSLVIACCASRDLWQDLLKSIAVIVIATCAGLVLAHFIGCDVLGRFELLANPLDHETSFSTASRFDLWVTGWEFFKQSPLVGHGLWLEAELSYPTAHLHNQYLSWLVAGGIPGLIFGLLPAVALLVYGWVKAKWQGIAIAFAVVGFAGMNFLTDSLLYWSDTLAQFLVMYAFAAGLIRNHPSATK
ncbi:MAG: O-antigen ligase family protein [Pseudomonadota bacterium]